ncbi:EAL domain-containing protein [Pseudomonas sp. Pseusp97]|uniref:EAL domain-containing response regulator n=1 Tax=Pseudomonas sp. Pseusp97 TaxID=3243065 RepID=UPI0039A64085
MTPRSALILKDPGLHRSTAASALQRLGFAQVMGMSCATQALEALRDMGAVDLLLCDVRAARLQLLRTAAREQLIRGVVIIGEPLPELWPALSRLLTLHGLYVRRLVSGPATHERLQKLLGEFAPSSAQATLPTLCEMPADREIVAALGHGEIRAALQPKIDVGSGAIHGFEVLARWQRGNGDELPPRLFLPALRRHGLLDALLFDLLDQAVSHLQAHACDELGLAFNLEPAQLAQPGFAARIESRLQRLRFDPRRITFELTESGRLPSPAISLDNLLHLRLLGCGLAMDDYGAGQSTLQRLLELPFSELKLDASFLARLDQDPRRYAVLENALALGRALGLPVVAEGVETQEQFLHLKRLGCEHVQGFYFSRPLLGSQLTHLLRGLGKASMRRFC